MTEGPVESAPLDRIRKLVATQRYRVRLHAVRHMIEEGFDETQLLGAILGHARILEQYPDEERYLLLGRFHVAEKTTAALHVLCDLSNEAVVDIVTAYIPRRPWWTSPVQRGRKR